MIRKRATVISWVDGIAKISIHIKQDISCDEISCFCYSKTCILGIKKRKTNFIISILNEKPLIKGQQIEVEIRQEIFLKIMMLIYLLPLFGFFFGSLSSIYNIETIAIIISLIGGIIGFLCAIFFTRSYVKKTYLWLKIK